MTPFAPFIIGALIGTDDLGQLILKSLSDKDGVGYGLVLGLCVAFFDLVLWSEDDGVLFALFLEALTRGGRGTKDVCEG